MKEIGQPLQRGAAGADQAPARPATTAGVPSRNVLRLRGVVIERGHSDMRFTAEGKTWSARSPAPLPAAAGRGARVVIEVPSAADGERRPAQLVQVGNRRLQMPVDLELRSPARGGAPPAPASRPGPAPPLAVSVRVVGEPGRPLQARLSVIHPAQPARPAEHRSTEGTLGPRPSGPATATTRAASAGTPPAHPTSQLPPDHSGDADGPLSPVAKQADPKGGASARPTLPLPSAGRQALPAGAVVLEAEVSALDGAERPILRAGERLLQVLEPVHLPKGARVRLSISQPSKSTTAAADVTTGEKMSTNAGGPRPLTPDTTLAWRLLDLVTRLAGEHDRRPPADLPAAARPSAAQAVQIRDQGSTCHVQEARLGTDTDLVPLRIYVSDDRADVWTDAGGQGRRELARRTNRAIVAVDLDHLGPCQLDVLCSAKRFDLRLRSEQVLPEEVRQEAVELFLAARDVAGLDGDLSFAPGELVTFEGTRSVASPLDV